MCIRDRDEATTAMLDEAATRYYESVATGLENEGNSDVESTLYDLGKDTQFAFGSQIAEEETRARRIERPRTKRGTPNNDADNNKLQFSIDKMDLYLFLTVFTAMSIMTLALAYQASMIIVVPAAILLYVTLQVAEPKIQKLLALIASIWCDPGRHRKRTKRLTRLVDSSRTSVSYTHLTLPTIYSV